MNLLSVSGLLAYFYNAVLQSAGI